MAIDIDIKLVRELMRALKQFDLSELDIREGEARIRIRRGGLVATGPTTALPVSAMSTVAPVSRASEPPPPAPVDDPDTLYVTSPFVGSFYRAPSPQSPPFVEIGHVVEVGQTLCIVEAMKLMNEIESDVRGRVLEVLVENGKPVEFGERLFRLQKL
ncbi:MAG: acetyl-CoA carboxylase biotin carboxyl carrier protein [Deltaproteobacteria bacterium]|nr:acetyl-CoA carboxylase biotin carboxyl carrier protein [Deltaproteobacteria bacterium]